MEGSEEKQNYENSFIANIIERFEKQKESEIAESCKSESVFHDLELIKKYQREFKGKKLENYFNGYVIKNSFGKCFSIINEEEIKIKISELDKVKQKYLSELRIIDGIGEFYEKKLNNEGYKSLTDLLKHHSFGRIANEFHGLINNNNGQELFKWLERRYPKSHPLVFLTSSFYNPKDFIFIDIESLGLHGYPLFLIGIACFNKNTLVIEQILARDMDEEAAVLEHLNYKLKKKKAIISFNGKSFDIPVIKNRMAYYQIKGDFNLPHFDIYHFSKRAFKDKLIDFKLTSLENNILNIKRKDHLPSFLIPEYYKAYLETKNIGSLVLIIEHNKQDIISTAIIFSKIHELWK